MSLFEVLVGLATIGSFFIALKVLQSNRTTGARIEAPSAQYVKPAPRPKQTTDEEKPKPGYPAIMIPDGVTLGDKVVLVPGLQQRLFTQTGRIEDGIWRDKAYSWINRGEVIGCYRMNIPNSNASYIRNFMGSTEHCVQIRSPVSGLIIFSKFSDFVKWPKMEMYSDAYKFTSFTVITPDDEPLPEGNAFMFRDVVSFIEERRDLFFRPSPIWSLGPMDAEQFDRLVKAQTDAECVIVDAMPRYQEFLEEARTRYPALRPYLKHLL